MNDHNEETREEMFDAITKLVNDEHELTNEIRGASDHVVAALRERGIDFPEELEEELYTALKCANIAIICAHIASRTAHTDEAGTDPCIILGTWAGILMQSREMDMTMKHFREMLGMGDN